MFSIANSSLSLLLVLVSAGLVAWNRKAWHSAKDPSTTNGVPAGTAGVADSAGEITSTQPEIAFAWRQFRRRVQASLMIGIVGIAIFGGQFLESPTMIATFWAGVIFLLLWIVALAMADILATQQHFGRVHRDHVAEQMQIQVDILRRGNPASRKTPRDFEATTDE